MLLKVVGDESSFRRCVIKDRPLMWVVDWKCNFSTGSQEELLRDLLGVTDTEDLNLYEFTDTREKGDPIRWDVSPRQVGLTSGSSIFVETTDTLSPRRVILEQERQKTAAAAKKKPPPPQEQPPRKPLPVSTPVSSDGTRCASTGLALVAPPKDLSQYFAESNYIFISRVTRICKWINKQQVFILKPTRLLLCGSRGDIKKYIDVRDVKTIWNVTKKKNTIVVQFYTRPKEGMDQKEGLKSRKERDLALIFPDSEQFIEFKKVWLSIMRTLEFKRPWKRASSTSSIPESAEMNPQEASPQRQRYNSTSDLPQIVIDVDNDTASRRRVQSTMVHSAEYDDETQPQPLSTPIYSSQEATADTPTGGIPEEMEVLQKTEVSESNNNLIIEQSKSSNEAAEISAPSSVEPPVSSPAAREETVEVGVAAADVSVGVSIASPSSTSKSSSPPPLPGYPENGYLDVDSSIGSPVGPSRSVDVQKEVSSPVETIPLAERSSVERNSVLRSSQTPSRLQGDGEVDGNSPITSDGKCSPSHGSNPPSSDPPSTPPSEREKDVGTQCEDCNEAQPDVTLSELLAQNERLFEELKRKDECIKSYQIALSYKDKIIKALQDEVAIAEQTLSPHSHPPSDDSDNEQGWVFNL